MVRGVFDSPLFDFEGFLLTVGFEVVFFLGLVGKPLLWVQPSWEHRN